jgi:hypothetical protein
MGDDFEFDSDDEAAMLAATENVVNVKRSNSSDHDTTSHPHKRTKIDDGKSIEVSSSTLLANKVLKSRFGMNGFRLEQEAAITRILDGGSAVVVFPTGGGKSLCYQVGVFSEEGVALLLTWTGSCCMLSIPRRGNRAPTIAKQRREPRHISTNSAHERSGRCSATPWDKSGCP